MIENDYRYRLYIDDLPSSTMERDDEGEFITDYDDGIPVGEYDEEDGRIMIYNHLVMTILTSYDGGSDEKQRIVGFEVEPQSIHYTTHSEDEDVKDDHNAKPQFLIPGETFRFSYSIETKVSDPPVC